MPTHDPEQTEEAQLAGATDANVDETVVSQRADHETSSEAPPQKPASKKVKQLGDFKILRKLGKGGMGEVFLAHQISLDRQVALKTLSKELAKQEDFVKRFQREARSMAKLDHQNAVKVYAVDSVSGIHFAAIEFIDGQSMQGLDG